MAWIGGALALALASLPFGRALAFDASAWVVWGREVWTLSLDTSAGPTWKPLPVLFTAPFAALGDAAPWAWLAVARAGALLAVAGVARLAWRASGPAAAIAAAGVVALSQWCAFNGALGNADPLLAALVVWALVAHADGRPRAAFALGVAAALIRPEVWPFLAAYAVWQARAEPRPEEPAPTLSWPLALGAGALVLALWLIPDLLASNLESLRGSTGTPSEGSAAEADVPFLASLEDFGQMSPWLVLVLACFGPLLGAGTRPTQPAGAPWVWLAGAVAYALLVALMAQAGFAGNPRYLVPALALVAASAGAALRGGWAGYPQWAAWIACAALVAAVAATNGDELRAQRDDLERRADARAALDDAIDRAGGRERLRRCGAVRSGAAQRTLVAELLRESIPAAARGPRAGEPAVVALPDGGWRVSPCADGRASAARPAG